jgi:hypothetical protein
MEITRVGEVNLADPPRGPEQRTPKISFAVRSLVWPAVACGSGSPGLSCQATP